MDAVHPRKRRRIAAMALDYLAFTRQLDAPCRFIVVAIDGLGTARQTVTVIEDAWESDNLYGKALIDKLQIDQLTLRAENLP